MLNVPRPACAPDTKPVSGSRTAPGKDINCPTLNAAASAGFAAPVRPPKIDMNGSWPVPGAVTGSSLGFSLYNAS